MNKLNKIQNILIKQLERLDNEKVMKENGQEELKRSSAISNTATTFVKSTDLNLRILSSANKFDIDANELNDYLGLNENE